MFGFNFVNLAIDQFATPDGSRFVIIEDDTVPQVHWAIASWIDGRDDPRGLPGLAKVTLSCSLRGTWRLGSKDAPGERKALEQLDAAWTDLRRNGASVARNQRASSRRIAGVASDTDECRSM